MTDARLDRSWAGQATTNALLTWMRATRRRMWRTAAAWYRRWRTRRQLAGFDERMRADLRLRWEDARGEARKPFWRP